MSRGVIASTGVEGLPLVLLLLILLLLRWLWLRLTTDRFRPLLLPPPRPPGVDLRLGGAVPFSGGASESDEAVPTLLPPTALLDEPGREDSFASRGDNRCRREYVVGFGAAFFRVTVDAFADSVADRRITAWLRVSVVARRDTVDGLRFGTFRAPVLARSCCSRSAFFFFVVVDVNECTERAAARRPVTGFLFCRCRTTLSSIVANKKVPPPNPPARPSDRLSTTSNHYDDAAHPAQH